MFSIITSGFISEMVKNWDYNRNMCEKQRTGRGGTERESKRMEKVNILGITSKPRCVSDLVNGNNG